MIRGFNPCFSGSCIRITHFPAGHSSTRVSILVLVDLAFESGREKRNCEQSIVSILVLVDLAFEYILDAVPTGTTRCFNPCFSGSCIRITKNQEQAFVSQSFNPCFSGSCIRIRTLCILLQVRREVSILVLVDLAFEYEKDELTIREPKVSILVLVDLAFEL